MQLTGLKYLVDNKLVPYIDLGVWGPFAGRMFKKLKFRGLVQTKAGEFHQVEIGGPPSMEIWQDHWEVAITAYISLKVVTLGTLQRYAELISSFHRRFGEGAWAVIYQADVRMRSEQFERIRRRGAKEKSDAVTAGGRHPFDENSPWQWVFEQAIGDLPFWKEQVEDVGTQVSFKAGSLGKALGGGTLPWRTADPEIEMRNEFLWIRTLPEEEESPSSSSGICPRRGHRRRN